MLPGQTRWKIMEYTVNKYMKLLGLPLDPVESCGRIL